MDKVRFGIVGIGKMGSIHAIKFVAGLVKGAVLTAVCDISEERRNWAKKNLKNVEIYENYNEMLDSGLIDAVVIAVPHYLHPIMATDALNKGLHTLIEKPAGVYTSAIRELNALAKSKDNLTFGIMYNQRTNPLYRYAKELVDAGRIGELKRINWIITDWYRPQAYYNQGGWRGTWEGEGGGCLINQCPHQLDLFQWLGGMPTKIRGYCQIGKNRDITVENDVTAYMEYANGATGIFITSTHDFPGTNRLEIDGDKGKLVIEGGKLVFTELDVSEKEFNATNTKFMPSIPSRKIVKKISKIKELALQVVGQHTAILRNFTNNILFGEKLIAPGEEGINGLTISNAIHLSHWKNDVVELPIDESAFEEELAKRIQEEKALNNK